MDTLHTMAKLLPTTKKKSPTFENMIVLSWLRLADRDLPNLVKQRYVAELRSRSLTSLKPVISQALQQLLEELHTAADSNVLWAITARFRRPNPQTHYKNLTQPTITRSRPRSCPYLTRARSTYNTDEEEPDSTEFNLPVEDEVDPPTHAFSWIVSRRVSTKPGVDLD